ncbi:hypothetical protein [Wenzhouxiangella sp. EGI_FJ10305]|uniref:hypothetical protein n=1 Tax=Wenzhouxiangella sp. EGI_FJ10305 TaxID=3243768 RepID=UPI0035D56E16
MNGYKLFMIPLLVVFLTACSNQPVLASNDPNLLIMGEDYDEDTVPRDSRVFRRVLNALSNQLHDEGFKVYDETAVSLDDFAQGRVRRSDAELIDIARSIDQPPIDVVVMFSIYASAKDVDYTTKVRTRVEGRLLNVRTGQRLGNFELPSPREWNAEPNCSRECILETVGGYARILANDVGAVLTEKLAWMVDGGGQAPGGGIENAYTLVFDGFTPEEIMTFEEYLVIFSGYRDHRPTYSGARRQELWYESQIEAARLNRNLQRMLQETGLRGVVTFSGSNFTVRKVTLRGERQRPDPNDDW